MISIIFCFVFACATSMNDQNGTSKESTAPPPSKELNSEHNDSDLSASEEASKSSPSILSTHETIAIFKGFKFTSMCTGLTANCPYKCGGNTKEEAFFTILEYTKYTQKDPSGAPKQDSISFGVHALPKQLREKITLEDKVRLHWTQESDPNEPKKGIFVWFDSTPKKITKIECFEECGLGEVSQCFTCNPDNATLEGLILPKIKKIEPDFQHKVKTTMDATPISRCSENLL